jgi:hypothetical protein
LPKSDRIVVGGEIQAYVLPGVAFVFLDTQDRLHMEQFDSIDVIEPTVDSPRPDFSIIGMDVLQRLNKLVYDFRRNEVTLEK